MSKDIILFREVYKDNEMKFRKRDKLKELKDVRNRINKNDIIWIVLGSKILGVLLIQVIFI